MLAIGQRPIERDPRGMTRAILADTLGYSAERVDALLRSGAVAAQ